MCLDELVSQYIYFGFVPIPFRHPASFEAVGFSPSNPNFLFEAHKPLVEIGEPLAPIPEYWILPTTDRALAG